VATQGRDAAPDYNRGLGIIRHNVPKVAAKNSFGILRNFTIDNKASLHKTSLYCLKITTLQWNFTTLKQTIETNNIWASSRRIVNQY